MITCEKESQLDSVAGYDTEVDLTVEGAARIRLTARSPLAARTEEDAGLGDTAGGQF